MSEQHRRTTLAVLLLATLWASASVPVAAQPAAATPAPTAEEPTGPTPFGANLFTGAFAGQREDGQNPGYQILAGDRVAVNAWGTVTVNDIFVVDTQGNIFLPGIGPVHLAGVRNSDLTETVLGRIRQVYRGGFDVYTNLLTASPVAVFVTGGVARPGRYAGIPSDSLLFFLDQAGGIHPEAGSYRHIQILHRGQTTAELDLYDFLLRGSLPTPQFEDGDTILVGRRGPTVEVRSGDRPATTVELAGERFTGAEVLSVLRGATGANEVTVQGLRDNRRIARTFPVTGFQQASLSDGDVVTFREEGRPDRMLVRLEGEFEGSSVLSVQRGSRLLDVLNFVPVDPRLANTMGAHVRRRSVARAQRLSIQQSLDRLERSAVLALSSSRGESEIRVREAEMVSQFVEHARNVQPLGRVVTSTAGHQLNVLLEEGDVIVLPARTNVVRIGGEVQIAQAVMFRPDLTVRDYVRMAGGFTNRAETDAVIVLRPNAEVTIGDEDMRIEPGDEIMVPPEIDHKIFQNALDVSQIIYQIAVAASVLVAL